VQPVVAALFKVPIPIGYQLAAVTIVNLFNKAFFSG
jgi:hypothetical protein